jgi:hypothetical protein
MKIRTETLISKLPLACTGSGFVIIEAAITAPVNK